MRIVGYTYLAEHLCRACMRQIAAFQAEAHGKNSEFVGVEDLLDFWAGVLSVNRYDESSYDSGDFPKVVFEDQVSSTEQCSACGEELR